MTAVKTMQKPILFSVLVTILLTTQFVTAQNREPVRLNVNFDHLLGGDAITDETLHNEFASIRRALATFGPGAGAIAFIQDGDRLFAHLTLEQQNFYLQAFKELLDEMKKVENAARRPTSSPSILPPLQDHLARIQLPGKEIAFAGTTLDSKPFDLKSLRGKVVLLDFWATYCGPCIAEIPEMKKYYEKFHARGFEVVGISIDKEEDRAKLVEFVKSRQLPWIQLHDPKGELHQKLHGQGVPYCLLLDQEGKVVLQYARGDFLKRKLDEMFSE
jgi:thiol-disulfide isomerase/thioredoxin